MHHQENCKVQRTLRDKSVPHTSPTRQRGICRDSPSLARRASVVKNDFAVLPIASPDGTSRRQMPC